MRINLYAGPGSGKSTMAAYLFSQLKIHGSSIELVSEYVKSWAIQKREIVAFDQVYLMGKQLQYEHRFLSNGIKNIVTDSPVLLSACYAAAFYPSLSDVALHMEQIILKYEEQFPAINIFLTRDDKTYNTEGRYQTYEEALAIDKIIMSTLNRLGIEYKEFSFFDQDHLLDYIKTKIE